jgi:signal transduction histidine kinase
MAVLSSGSGDEGTQYAHRQLFLKVFSAHFWKSTAFLVLSYPFGVFWFWLIFFLLSLSVSTAIILIGVPIFAATMAVWMAGARVERWRFALCFGGPVPVPYRPLPAGSLLARALARARDIAVWRDLLYLLLLFPVGTFDLVIVVVALGAPLSLVAMPLYFWAIHGRGPAGLSNLFTILNQIDDLPKAVLAAFIGILWLLLGQYLVAGIARGHAALARTLLGPTHQSQEVLEGRIATLSKSRSRIMGVSVSERQRIERDLHDGAQQRLVALALDLGMAKDKLAVDPVAAQMLVAAAHEEAKQALAEIRNLVRGIYPAVLADRGLDAAISALAGRCPVPVAVTVELDERPSEMVESTAYFLIAEALANVAKHSQATEAWVDVRRDNDRLLVDITDNGVGGADPTRGTGLAGLGDRVAALDGQFAVSSPPGGPTRISGVLPCES